MAADRWADQAMTWLAEQGVLPADRPLPAPTALISKADFTALLIQLQAARTVRRLSVPLAAWPVAAALERQPPSQSAPQTQPLPAAEQLSRASAIALLVEALQLAQPLVAEPLLALYFDDAAAVRPAEQRPIAAATLAGLVVSYPDVRRLQPQSLLTWAAAAAMFSLALGQSQAVPPQYVSWYGRLDRLAADIAVPFWQLRGNGALVQELQTKLQHLQLYRASQRDRGRFSLDTQTALLSFCQTLQLTNAQTYQFDAGLIEALQQVEPIDFSLRAARNRDRIFREYLSQEAGYDASHLAFLDKGIAGSPFEKQVEQYPKYLQQKRPVGPPPSAQPPSLEPSAASSPNSAAPGLKSLLLNAKARLLQTPPANAGAAPSPSPAAVAAPVASAALNRDRQALCLTSQPFPPVGSLPKLHPAGLAFLHPDIQQACLCLGQFINGQLVTTWLGRNALSNQELWSATKIVPLLHLVCQMQGKAVSADIDNQVIRAGDRGTGFSVHDLAVDMVNYQYAISSSNALAAMFKLFATPQTLEQWLKGITGNRQLKFRGNYGEGPFMGNPVLWDKQLQQVVLQAAGSRHGGPNTLSAYDLTRLMTMVGWHLHLPAKAQLPKVQWKSLESIVRALGKDSARYLDVAIERLGLRSAIQTPVIISKMGFGYSGQRRRTELVYTALVQFVDARPNQADQLGRAPVRTFGLTLLAASQLGDNNREARLLDARLAAEVTEILRRVMLDEWLA